jgi:hypothetical protein
MGGGSPTFMLSVLDDKAERTETRMQAAAWLADLGFGKATPSVEEAQKRSRQPPAVASSPRTAALERLEPAAESIYFAQPRKTGSNFSSRSSPSYAFARADTHLPNALALLAFVPYLRLEGCGVG